MKKFLIYLTSFLFLFGVSTTFAGVYSEDFEDGMIDPDWYVYGDYVIEEETPDNKYLRMYHAKTHDPGDIPCTEVKKLDLFDEIIYRIEADLLVPEERYQIVGIGYQWGICVDDENLICNGLQVSLNHIEGFFQAGIGSYSTTGGGTHLGQVDFPPVNFGEWHHLSITIHEDHVTIGINGNETDLFHGLYYNPQPGSYTWFSNSAGVGGCAPGPADPNFVDVDYSIDNLTISASTGETIDEVLDSVEEWIEDGDLVGTGEGNSVAGRLNAFVNMLENARDLLNAGDIAGGCDQLAAAYRKCDGESPPPDFVEGNEAQNLRDMIEILMTDFECQ